MKRNLTKLTALLLTLALLLTGLSAFADGILGAFTDVKPTAWYAELAAECAKNGWIGGYPDGTFRPNVKMNRAMFVTVLCKVDGGRAICPESEEPVAFADVPQDAWYAQAVSWAAKCGVVSGVGGGKFAPMATVTREQAALILKNYAALCLTEGAMAEPNAVLVEFLDMGTCADWAKDAVRWMQQRGLVAGDDQGNFLPKKALTRAEGAALMRTMYYYVNRPEPLEGVQELTEGYEKRELTGLPQATEDDRLALLNFCMKLSRGTLNGGQNAVLSPMSALYALGMTANGARGTTKTELEAAFGLPVDRLNAYLYNYGKLLREYPVGQFNLADSIWINEANPFTVKQAYLQKLVDFYDAQAFSGTFDDSLCNAINIWVKNNTFGMIPKTLEQVNPDAALYLINTLALKQQWAEPYESTQDGVFHPAAGEEQPCQMLYGVEERYVHDENTTGFVKGYGNGFQFVALLPDEGVSMDDYLASLDGEKLAGLLGSVERDCIVHTAMPEFETDSSFSLVDAVQSMGVNALFSPSADLREIGEADLFVSGILQKVHLKLDKDGTEAAAVTVIAIETSAAPGEDPIPEYTVTLDRPFVYMILDSQMQLPLFIGVVNGIG